MKHYNLLISGRVQGVFFRASTCEKAIELGIRGWVRNTDNGDVYVEAEGDSDPLESFVEWCKRGPRLARVDSVKITEADWQEIAGFEIRR